MELPYNPNDKESIIAFAKLLKGKTLRMACNQDILEHNYTGKGNFGQVLEKFYFLYTPNSDSEPDFPVAGLELKTSQLKQLVTTNEYRAKERLVLNIINYLEIVKQDFETSSFFRKNKNLLIVFYLFNKNVNILDRIIKLVDVWNFPKTDLEVIKRDWEFIKQKIFDGKAHELSEGDTFYLGACTKGGKKTKPRIQPNNEAKAKQRAFSFKQGYVDHIIATIAKEPENEYGKLIPSLAAIKNQTLEELVTSRFEPYYGKTIEEIIISTGATLNLNSKSFYADLTKIIFGIELNKNIEEFDKAEIITRTVRLKENNLPTQAVSFPSFKFIDLVKEKWEKSNLKKTLEHKFFFVFFQYEGEKLVLRKAKFWNMPFQDILEAEKVWTRTKEVINSGNIVSRVANGIRYTNFPDTKFNHVLHVRPHATNAASTYPLPAIENFTQEMEYTKQCFWLNKTYVRDKIFLK